MDATGEIWDKVWNAEDKKRRQKRMRRHGAKWTGAASREEPEANPSDPKMERKEKEKRERRKSSHGEYAGGKNAVGSVVAFKAGSNQVGKYK